MSFDDGHDPADPRHGDRSRRDLLGFLLLAAVAALLIVAALVIGGGVGDD